MASVLVIVPKDDEFRGVIHELAHSGECIEETVRGLATIYHTTIEGKSLAIAVLHRQTNTYSGVLTSQLIGRENPRQIYLVGTALGRSDIKAGSVIIADRIADITERRQGEDGKTELVVGRTLEPDDELLQSARDFVGEYSSETSRRQLFESIDLPPNQKNDHYDQTKKDVLTTLPIIAVEPILSGNDYYMLPTLIDSELNNNQPEQKPILERFKGYKAYDMESVGFCLAAEMQKVPWLVIRAISDHGVPGSKKDRRFTTQAAAIALREFLMADIPRIERISSAKPRLSSKLSQGIEGEFCGFMGYYDDDGELVLYRERTKIKRVGESLEAQGQSTRTHGASARSREYWVDIHLGDRLSFSGAWGSLPNSQETYFGSLAGHVSEDYGTVEGVWTGGHKQGVRIGRFVWYIENMASQNPDIETDREAKFRKILEQQIRPLKVNTGSI